VQRFAALLDALAFQPQRNGKLRLLADYFRSTPDPDRGWALAALTGGLAFRHVKPGAVRALVLERVDEVLFGLSYDYVGDLAETVSLIWPAQPGANAPLGLAEAVEGLASLGREAAPRQLARWLDGLPPAGRWALIKLVTGGLRVGVSQRLALAAVARLGSREEAEVQEAWHAERPPYPGLFRWALGEGPRPLAADPAGAFRPVMLAHPLDEADLAGLDPEDFLAEWKWDGVRVQVAGEGGQARLWSRTAEDMRPGFPDVAARIDFRAVLDGELLIVRDGVAGSFAELQRRLNRRTAPERLQADLPAGVRLYDALWLDGEDLRPLPFAERRRRLEAWYAWKPRPGFDLSPLLAFADWPALAAWRAAPAEPAVEGVMLKRRGSPYLPGRPKGHWFKWKRAPMLADAVLMYAQRGHGKRSSFFSDYTFGVWKDGELVPVGKAYFGFTDAELKELDRWVRHHAIERFGPVVSVERRLVLEVAFEGIQVSGRHKAGLAMRFPRISRIRWDKPAEEADRLETLAKLAAA